MAATRGDRQTEETVALRVLLQRVLVTTVCHAVKAVQETGMAPTWSTTIRQKLGQSCIPGGEVHGVFVQLDVARSLGSRHLPGGLNDWIHMAPLHPALSVSRAQNQ